MSEIGEGFAELGQGAIAGRVFEPRHGEARSDDEVGADGHTHERACLNCGTMLAGHYCHACGQAAHVHRTARAVLHDFLHGVLHLEGKTFRTLPLLAFKPGELTRRYIHGERAGFNSPMALFLFSVFTMFAVFSFMGISTPTAPITSTVGDELASVDKRLEERKVSLTEAIEDRRAEGNDTAELEKRLAKTDEELEALRSIPGIATETSNADRISTGWKRLDKGIVKWRENPGLMLYKLQTNAYKFSWLLIPISLPFMWLIFVWRRRFGLYDHAVFITYSIAFMSLMMIVLTVVSGFGIPGGVLYAIFGIIAPFHIYRQLKGAYELSRFSAIWRTVALIAFIHTVILGLFATALFMLGLMG
ncbi:hypothetical protein GCM10011371_32100 [Novosphingobium marinum]|uniref:DUF3667 domain-containing protein n=1 Tax=Novosphingobium marinum TaxID=1514948 RepID=A0A7Y9Y0W5_9SPHN|nr:DUF3667 domain-containing protein [Novosphingobium marinum]NYH96930.1 hypothetical protein [Novosphingobium marinum]GGC42268.1 hypothetical protein GCM10011371_32100 [Novosphingobium marinum]